MECNANWGSHGCSVEVTREIDHGDPAKNWLEDRNGEHDGPHVCGGVNGCGDEIAQDDATWVFWYSS